MTTQQDIFTIEMQDGENCILQNMKEKDGITEYEFLLSWTKENAAKNDRIYVHWMAPIQGAMYKWDGSSQIPRGVYPPWDDTFTSMISRNAPVSSFFDGNDINRYCWALSECQKLVSLQNCVQDHFSCLKFGFSITTAQYTNRYSTTVTLRIDKRPVTLRKAVSDVAEWWAKDLGMTPAYVPPAAREPLYSFWYSYHQHVDEKTIEEECRRAKDMGFEVCIVDDGWQTEHYASSYAYCGDWKPVPSKFPDMAAHVKRVHEIGMKYVLWYSVPFVGYYSENYARFQNMLLRDVPGAQAGLLDPRYREVRDFVIDIYKKALLEWDLDGFKLDFIDNWNDEEPNEPYNEKMDIPALQDAVDICMTDLYKELTKIKPDVLLEFRQDYIGPHMKRLGNMFRVGDCAGNYLKNRSVVLDLRMLMGDQTAHSDMLMMAPEEAPEINALQVISCMFGVMQYSGKLDSITPETMEMSRFWLHFLKEHKDLLQSRNLETHEAHLHYTWAKVTEGRECAIGVYAIDKCVKPDAVDTIYIANGCMGERILLELTGTYQVQILDCYGHEVSGMEKAFDGISCIPMPVGGLMILRKQL